MSRQPSIWDRPSFDKLWAATKLAAEAGQESFTLDLGRKKGRHDFLTTDAINLCDRLYNDFEGTPTRVYPENREGKEP